MGFIMDLKLIKKRFILLIPILLVSFSFVFSSRVEATTENYIQDNTDRGWPLFSPEELDRLNQKLNDFSESTTSTGEKANAQFAVYLTNSIGSSTIEEFSKNLFNEKQIGDKKHNKGILLVIALQDHKYRIQLGDGWKNTALTETSIKSYVFNDSLTQLLRDASYAEAINQMVDDTIAIAGQELQIPRSLQTYTTAYKHYKKSENMKNVAIILLVFLIASFVTYKKSRYKRRYQRMLLEYAGDKEREFLTFDEREVAEAFATSKMEMTDENIRQFIRRLKHNEEMILHYTVKNKLLRQYDYKRQALSLTKKKPNEDYKYANVSKVLANNALCNYNYWKESYVQSLGYKDMNEYDRLYRSSNYHWDSSSRSSSSWSDFGGGGSSSGDGASGSW